MKLQLGRVAVAIGPTMYVDSGFHFLDGRRYARLLLRIEGSAYHFGRGFVLAVGPLMDDLPRQNELLARKHGED